MKYILSDAGNHQNFLPLAYTRAIADFRIGILTIREKWNKYLGHDTEIHTEEYLQVKYSNIDFSNSIIINSSILPSNELCSEILNLKNDALVYQDSVIALKSTVSSAPDFSKRPDNCKEYKGKVNYLHSIPSLFLLSHEEIVADYNLITKDRQSQQLSNTNIVIGNGDVFLEEGAIVEACTLNTLNGPIYIGRNAEIMEGTNIRGSFAACDNSVVKMGAKIYGATTIGVGCKVGGEINNSVFFANSNKAHDGFIGNSVIGEWCNLGADTNNSNLKNNYANVKLWNYHKQGFLDTGLQFCGLIMGDHSKSAINTMFNTGTVVGVSSNIFGEGFPRNFIPSFSWGGHAGVKEYKIDKAIETMNLVLKRRGLELSDEDEKIYNHIYNITSKYRFK
jgi:UDP-N-acetylglucosamine diphosphorylase/glucosamine-1-phosphate N-acetyltransferase